MRKVRQFLRGLKRVTLFLLAVATLPIWIIPLVIYSIGDDTRCNDYW